MEEIITFMDKVLATTIMIVQWLIHAFWETLGHILSGNFNDATIGAILVFTGAVLFLILILMMIIPKRKSFVPPDRDILAGLTIYQRAGQQAGQQGEQQGQSDHPIKDEREDHDPIMRDLRHIEQDMLALKELFDAGLIKAQTYISESKLLYQAAKNIYPD
jgi:hypothetical protein